MISYQNVFVGSECNNDCVACPARDEEKTRDITRLVHEIDTLADVENLQLCGGEPTLHRDLLSLISHARSRGARRIKLVTNGRKLAEWDLLAKLAEEGCRLFEVKIHGSRPETHQAVTGIRGSFDETLQGLQNLAALSSSEDYEDSIFVAARVAVTRGNLEDLTSTMALLVSFGVDRIVLDRRGVDFSMSEAAPIVANAMKVAALNRAWSMCKGFPPCLMKGSEMHVSELLQPSASQGDKPKGCRSCTYAGICVGLPQEYVRKRGSREFRAVSASPYLEDINHLLETRSSYAKQ